MLAYENVALEWSYLRLCLTMLLLPNSTHSKQQRSHARHASCTITSLPMTMLSAWEVLDDLSGKMRA